MDLKKAFDSLLLCFKNHNAFLLVYHFLTKAERIKTIDVWFIDDKYLYIF